VTLTSPHEDGIEDGVCDLIDRIQAVDRNFPLRVVPLRIQVFTPVGNRLSRDTDRGRSLFIQEKAIAVWNAEIERRFDVGQRAKPIFEVSVGGDHP